MICAGTFELLMFFETEDVLSTLIKILVRTNDAVKTRLGADASEHQGASPTESAVQCSLVYGVVLPAAALSYKGRYGRGADDVLCCATVCLPFYSAPRSPTNHQAV